MPISSEEHRRSLRQAYVNQFLAEIGVPLASVSASARHELSEWARQVRLVEDQPSANWRWVVVQMCVAVESQLVVSLGSIPGFAFLAGRLTLGQQAWKLKRKAFEASDEHQLAYFRIKPDFVRVALPELMLRLTAVRKAHGNVQSSTAQDAAEARRLAAKIFRGIVPNQE